MKRVLIQDDDGDLFNVPLQPIIYHCYRENKKEIRRMVKQQSAGFWIQFVTSFRSFISNCGLDRTARPESYEEAFIDMLKLLTTENSFTEFISLIESLKRLHVLLDSLCGYFMMDAHIITAQGMSGFDKPLHTFPIYSRFVGSVVILYQRWKHAPRVRAHTSPAKWIPPAHWSQPNGTGPSSYESYLHDCWGNKLYRMIHVDKDLMKFFKPQERYDTSSASSSTGQNRVGTTYATRLRRNRKRGRRNGNGGITRPSGTKNEAVLVHERHDTDSPGAKEHRSNSDGNRNNVQTKSQSGNFCQKQEPKKETVPSTTTGDKTERNDRFRYDKLFQFSSMRMKEDDGQKSGTSSSAVEDASGNVNMTRKDVTFRYDRLFSFKEKRYSNGKSESNVLNASTARNENKDRVPLPADPSLRYNRLFTFNSKKHTDQNSSEVGANNNADCINMKTKQKDGSVPSHKEQEPTSYHDKTADSFRYDRLFNFSKKSTTVKNWNPEENDEVSGNSKIGDAKKKETVHQCKDKEFTTNRDKTRKAGEKDFFRYDRLFNFSARKQNFPDCTEKGYTTSSGDDLYEYDSDDSEYIGFNGFSRASFGGPFQSGNHKKRMLQPVRKFLMHKCNSCNILEKYPGMYKVCRLCVKHRVQAPNVYCGEHCRRTHWLKQHCADHFP